jgi:hypothetical protein
VPQSRHQQTFDDLDFVRREYGPDIARAYGVNTHYSGNELSNSLAAIRNAPFASGIERVVRDGSLKNNPGHPFELVRARDNVDDGLSLLAYGASRSVGFRRVRRVVNGVPQFDVLDQQDLDGDSIYSLPGGGQLWTDSKIGNITINSVSALNQILKAQAAINDPLSPVTRFRFEAAGTISPEVRQWARVYAPNVEFLDNLPGRP